jgi:hypothetical protein
MKKPRHLRKKMIGQTELKVSYITACHICLLLLILSKILIYNKLN